MLTVAKLNHSQAQSKPSSTKAKLDHSSARVYTDNCRNIGSCRNTGSCRMQDRAAHTPRPPQQISQQLISQQLPDFTGAVDPARIIGGNSDLERPLQIPPPYGKPKNFIPQRHYRNRIHPNASYSRSRMYPNKCTRKNVPECTRILPSLGAKSARK